MIVELGVEARLLRLQLDEMYGDIEDELDLVIADYVPLESDGGGDARRDGSRSPTTRFSICASAAGALHREEDPKDLDQEVAPKGLRLLNRVHRLSDDSASRIVEHFGGLARLQRATVPDLMEVDGVDDATAASIKEALQRVTETAILDQYS